MNREQWVRHIIWAVGRAANGNTERLDMIAQTLADYETARDALICAGYGTDGDSLCEVVAEVVEEKQLQDE